jgi:hypothetical protein
LDRPTNSSARQFDTISRPKAVDLEMIGTSLSVQVSTGESVNIADSSRKSAPAKKLLLSDKKARLAEAESVCKERITAVNHNLRDKKARLARAQILAKCDVNEEISLIQLESITWDKASQNRVRRMRRKFEARMAQSAQGIDSSAPASQEYSLEARLAAMMPDAA